MAGNPQVKNKTWIYVCVCMFVFNSGKLGEFQSNLVRVLLTTRKITPNKILLELLGVGWEGVTCKNNRKRPLLMFGLAGTNCNTPNSI